MSLNHEELVRTSAELHINLARTGLSTAQVVTDLDWTHDRLEKALSPDSSDPVDVWQLRDYLDQAVRDAGHEPVPFTVLTSAARWRARAWFRLRRAPRHEFSAG